MPVKLFSLLQRGEPVRLGDCEVSPDEVLGPARRGLSFLYATDTRPVQTIAEAGRDTDLMILEGMYGAEEDLPKALKNRHMLSRESAALAREAGTARLLLTHFSTAVEDPGTLLPPAREIFPETDCAHDGMTLTLGWTEKRMAEERNG